jgi:hypothetical protein
VSCAAPGDCSAGGYDTGPRGISHAFVVGQAHGGWGQARQVPGLAALTKGGNSEIDAVSCAAPGHCAAGGLLIPPHSKHVQVFVVTQTSPPQS